jgi:hypothetical protein
MKVLMLCANYAAGNLGITPSSGGLVRDFYDCLLALPKNNAFDLWFDQDVVYEYLDLMELSYSQKHDTAYWFADLAVVSVGVVSAPPSVSQRGDRGSEDLFDSGRVKITAIECLNAQMPACFCAGV